MKYYEAYEERYKTIHQKGQSWSSDVATPIVMDVISSLNLSKEDKILEIGCGEGRDARVVLEKGYNLLATDISNEAIKYCQESMPEHSNRFQKLDCLNDKHDEKYKFIYAVAVIHMLVLDEDRKLFYNFIHDHLLDDGYALICSMGDGETEMKSDINVAFEKQKRNHPSGEVEVAATSCRMASFFTMEKELEAANLKIVKEGLTSSLPEFDSLMFFLVNKA